MTLGFHRLPTDRPFVAADVDLSTNTLARLVVDGHLRRVVRGVFVDSSLPDTLALRAAAVGLVVAPHAVVTDRTAAWLHGVDVLRPGDHLAVPDVQMFDRRPGRRTRRDTVRSGERTMRDFDVQVIGDLTVTTPLRTAMDLGRQRWPDRAFAEAEAMVRAGVSVEDILHHLPRFAGYRWIRQFRELAPLLDPRPDSIPESVMRFQWLGTSAPRPEPQRPVIGPDGQTWRLDLGVDELFFAVEYDGEEFHTSEEDREYDAWRRAWIDANTPWLVKVIGKEHLFGRHADFDSLLPGWIREARGTLGERLRRGRRWYDDVGD